MRFSHDNLKLRRNSSTSSETKMERGAYLVYAWFGLVAKSQLKTLGRDIIL